MFSSKLDNLIEKAIKAELKNAKKQGEFADIYHAYAILKEEVEEAKNNMSAVEAKFEYFWKFIKGYKNYNEIIGYCLCDMNVRAEEAVKELIQVLAVLRKIEETFL